MDLPPGLSWHDASDGRAAPHAVHGGETSDGRRVWIARSDEEREVAVGYLVSGEHFARIPYFGRTLRRTRYQVLSNGGDVALAWVDAKLGQVPDASIAGGRAQRGHEDPIYISRVRYKNATLPAKLLPRAKRAFVSFDGREVARREYQVLTVTSGPRYFDTNVGDTPAPHGLDWVSVSTKDGNGVDESIREKAIRLAFLDDSDRSSRTFVVRAALDRQLAPGGWCADSNEAYIPYFGHAVPCTQFQMLVRTSSDVELFWSDAYQDDIPDDALLAGKDDNGHPVYIARTSIDGMLAAGKVIPACSKAFFADGMDETARQGYQILCMHVATSTSELPADSDESTVVEHSSVDGSSANYEDDPADSHSRVQSRSHSAEKYESGDSIKVGPVDRRREGFVSATRSQFEIPFRDTGARPANDVMLAVEDESTPFLLVSTDFSGYASQLRMQQRRRRTCSRNVVLVAVALFAVAVFLTWPILSAWK